MAVNCWRLSFVTADPLYPSMPTPLGVPMPGSTRASI